MDEIYQLAVPVVGAIAVILVTYFAINWFLKGMKKTAVTGKNIRLIERMMIAQDKALLLVETAGKTYFLGASGNSIETIDSFDSGVFSCPAVPENKADFGSVLAVVSGTLFPSGKGSGHKGSRE